MENLSNIGVILGSSWTSGVNLYLTVAALGILQRMHAITLPGSADNLGNPLVIGLAVILYIIEFVADKIPLVDNLWDSIHTIIRPAGAAMIGHLAASHLGPAAQNGVAMLAGSVAATSHLTKATTRIAINSVPIPFLNSAASLGEDGIVVTVLWFVVKHPVITTIIVVALLVVCVFILVKLFRFVGSVFKFLFRIGGRKEATSQKSVS